MTLSRIRCSEIAKPRRSSTTSGTTRLAASVGVEALRSATKSNSDEVLKFFDWAFKNGKKDAIDLDYVPLPDALTKQIRERVWTQIK